MEIRSKLVFLLRERNHIPHTFISHSDIPGMRTQCYTRTIFKSIIRPSSDIIEYMRLKRKTISISTNILQFTTILFFADYIFFPWQIIYFFVSSLLISHFLAPKLRWSLLTSNFSLLHSAFLTLNYFPHDYIENQNCFHIKLQHTKILHIYKV